MLENLDQRDKLLSMYGISSSRDLNSYCNNNQGLKNFQFDIFTAVTVVLFVGQKNEQ